MCSIVRANDLSYAFRVPVEQFDQLLRPDSQGARNTQDHSPRL